MKAVGERSIASVVTVVLSVACGLAALGLVLAVLLALFSPFVHGPMQVDAKWLVVGSNSPMTIPVSFTLDSQTHHLAAPSLGIDNAEIQHARGFLSFPASTGPFVVGNALLVAGIFALALWVLVQLRAVFLTLRAGEPFVPANATRIKWIGWGIIVGELARSAVLFFENLYAMNHFTGDGLQFSARPEVDLFAILCGSIILVIAEVFRIGARLDEEQSLTV